MVKFPVQQAFEISQELMFSFMLTDVEELEQIASKSKVKPATGPRPHPRPSIRKLAKTKTRPIIIVISNRHRNDRHLRNNSMNLSQVLPEVILPSEPSPSSVTVCDLTDVRFDS